MVTARKIQAHTRRPNVDDPSLFSLISLRGRKAALCPISPTLSQIIPESNCASLGARKLPRACLALEVLPDVHPPRARYPARRRASMPKHLRPQHFLIVRLRFRRRRLRRLSTLTQCIPLSGGGHRGSRRGGFEDGRQDRSPQEEDQERFGIINVLQLVEIKGLAVLQKPRCESASTVYVTSPRAAAAPLLCCDSLTRLLSLFPNAATTELARCAGNMLTSSGASRSNIQRTSLRASAGASFD
jgi:hypothetical protein